MERRRLGHSKLFVGPLALGGNVFGWTVDEATSFQILDAFVDAGLNLIDTADMYSTWVPGNHGGESETLIGKWLKRSGRRNQVLLATKVGMEMNGHKGLSRAHIVASVEDSLKRLQTDVIDLYQSHQDDPLTPLEETLAAFADLIEAGKVRTIGASNFSAKRLQQSIELSRRHSWPQYVSLQPQYNLYSRQEFETELEPMCDEYGLGVLPYFALASGFLTGKYRDLDDAQLSPRGPGVVAKYLNERGRRILTGLDQVAEQTNSSVARVALAWLIARTTAPIASATSLEQLQELTAAARLNLDAASLDTLNRVSRYGVTARTG